MFFQKNIFTILENAFRKKCFVLFFQKNPKKCVQIKCVSKKDIFTTLEFLSKEIVSFQKMCLSKFSFQKRNKNKNGVNIVNLFICCNLKLFLRLMLWLICVYGSFPCICRHQSSSHCPYQFFGTNVFYLSSFHMIKMRNLRMITRCYISNSLLLFFCCSLFVYSN